MENYQPYQQQPAQYIDSNDISYITLKDGRTINVSDVEIIPKANFQENLYSSYQQNEKEIIPYETEQNIIYESPQSNRFSKIYNSQIISSITPDDNYKFYISNSNLSYKYTQPEIPKTNTSYFSNINKTYNENYTRAPIYSSTFVRRPVLTFSSNPNNKIINKTQFHYSTPTKITHGNFDNYKYVEIKGYGRPSTRRTTYRSNKKSQVIQNNNNNSTSNYKIIKSYGTTHSSGRNSKYSSGRFSRYSNQNAGFNRNIKESLGPNVWRGTGMRKRKPKKYA